MLEKILFVCALPILLIGCSSNTGVSPQSEAIDPRVEGTFTFYRLDGDRYPGDPVPQGAVLLHGWPILQSCSITSMSTRKQLFKAFDDGIAEIGRVSSNVQIDCFNPHHAIRVENKGVVVDYVICFKCQNYDIWENDKKIGGGNTSKSPKAIFDRVLDECR